MMKSEDEHRFFFSGDASCGAFSSLSPRGRYRHRLEQDNPAASAALSGYDGFALPCSANSFW